ncbi:MAG: ABC transporter ATP-binding protein [Dehalococcoidales bacterium]|nr:ABC transporter ATP-binding protein [Dehalococcoidales bacterium]
MLSLENVSIYYGRVRAVRDVNLTVAAGEIVALIGANGAGKTSLLNAVAGIVPVGAGRIVLNGEEITGRQPHNIVRRGLGYVPEGRQLFSTMSVEDNLLLGAYTHCSGRWRSLLGHLASFRRQTEVAKNLARVFDLFPVLWERREQRSGSLSGGEQQMLAIGRALMSSPRMLLLDEPSIGLAPQIVREIITLVGRLREAGLTILLVEQDAVAALKVADRGYVMEQGRIALEGLGKELLASERVRHAYLGRTTGVARV